MAQTNESQEQVTVNVETLQPVTRTLMTIGALPTSYLISMTYEEQLLWLQNYLIKTVIPAINNNAEATQEVQDIVMTLQDYINTQFSELNLQEYIDNKLDEMLESGVFENILMDYVQLTKVYDTYNDMIFDASTFTNGMKLKTIGYHFINDGGGAEYIVTNVQNDNKYQVSIGTNLWIELIINDNTINIKQFGAYGDGIHDDSEKLKNILENLTSKNVVYFPQGEYLCETDITIPTDNIRIYGDGREISTINFNNNGSLTFNGSQVKIENLDFNKQTKIEFNKYHCSIKSCSINYGNIGLLIKHGYINQVINCYITQNKIGVILEEESFETIIDNSVIDNNELGVLITGGSTGARITNCTIEGNRNRNTNQGCGLAISTTSTNFHLANCWFENNGSSNESCDFVELGNYNDNIGISLYNYVNSLYNISLKPLSGIITIENSHFTYTQYGIITSGYKNKTIVNNCSFTGQINKYNKPILYYSYNYDNGLICNNNIVINTENQNINTEMLSGVKLSYIHTNMTFNNNNQRLSYINGNVFLDNKPLFVYEEYITNLSNVKYLEQWQSGGTSYDSGILLGKKTNSYPTSSPAIYIYEKGQTHGSDVFDTDDVSYTVIQTYGSIFQSRMENNIPTPTTPYYDGVFPIVNGTLYNKTAFGIGSNLVIFALIQFNENEKLASKQCLAFKPIDYNYSQINVG